MRSPPSSYRPVTWPPPPPRSRRSAPTRPWPAGWPPEARVEVQRYLQSRVAADFEEIYASLV